MWVVARQQAPRQGSLLMCPVSLQALRVSIYPFICRTRSLPYRCPQMEAAGDGEPSLGACHARFLWEASSLKSKMHPCSNVKMFWL